MKKEIADKWVADLRTNPPQCKKVLYNGKGYCCLGRLCVVLGIDFKKQGESGSYLPDISNDSTVCEGVLPISIMNKAGMAMRNGQLQEGKGKHGALSAMNDRGDNFAEIADIIEKEWEYL
jgi:hypothetical protein